MKTLRIARRNLLPATPGRRSIRGHKTCQGRLRETLAGRRTKQRATIRTLKRRPDGLMIPILRFLFRGIRASRLTNHHGRRRPRTSISRRQFHRPRSISDHHFRKRRANARSRVLTSPRSGRMLSLIFLFILGWSRRLSNCFWFRETKGAHVFTPHKDLLCTSLSF